MWLSNDNSSHLTVSLVYIPHTLLLHLLSVYVLGRQELNLHHPGAPVLYQLSYVPVWNGRIRTCISATVCILLSLLSYVPRKTPDMFKDRRVPPSRSAGLSRLSRIPARLLVISVITHRVVPAWRGFSRTHRIPTVSRAYSGCAVDQIGTAGLEPASRIS